MASTGDPARLIHHLGLGVWSFLASPASGLVEGARRGAPERIAAGMLDGTRSLITNTIYAFSNATAKMSSTARKVRVMASKNFQKCKIEDLKGGIAAISCIFSVAFPESTPEGADHLTSSHLLLQSFPYTSWTFGLCVE